jgi:hypothetical protein
MDKRGRREEAGLFRRGPQFGMEIPDWMFHAQSKPRTKANRYIRSSGGKLYETS